MRPVSEAMAAAVVAVVEILQRAVELLLRVKDLLVEIPAPTRIRTLGVVVVARLPREDLEMQARAQAAQALHTSATRSVVAAVVDV